jgi:hypothetical protein
MIEESVMTLKTFAVISLCAAGIMVSPDAFAKNDKNHGNDDSGIVWHNDRHGDNNLNVQINFGDRQIIRDYLDKKYTGGHCPPGLAKKHNGCLPPGQARKYRIGAPLDRDVTIYDLPTVLLGRLNPPPRGYVYGMVDNDVVLVSRENRLIVDAVSLLMQ